MDNDLNNEIIEAAIAGLEEHKLTERWSQIVSATEPGRPHKVLRLDEENTSSVFYYIVPFEAGDRVPLAVKVGGNPLKFQQAVAAESLEEDVIAILPPSAVRGSTIGVVVSSEDGTSMALSEENIPEQTPLLAWKPSVASFSPFWPFYQVTITHEGQGQRDVLISTLDGKTLPTHNAKRGGA